MPDPFNEYAPLAKVLVKPPLQAYRNQKTLDLEWQNHHYLERPDYEKSVEEHRNFVKILEQQGSTVLSVESHAQTSIDSLYMRDSSLLTPKGMILCNMGKGLRSGESGAVREYFETNDFPILGQIQSPGTVEGGDVIWLDEKTLCIANGYRTNPEGINQLRYLLPDVRVIDVSLPHWNGPDDVLHLMSFISPVDQDLAVIYPRMMPVSLMNYLKSRSIAFVEVPDEEYDSMGCNVLALGPRNCLMIEGNPITKSRLEAAGCQVTTYKGKNISLLGAGGPTCLTRPLSRKS